MNTNYTMTTTLPAGFDFDRWEDAPQRFGPDALIRIAVRRHQDGRVAKREFHDSTPTGVWTIYETD